MRRLAAVLFTLLVAAPPALAQPYPDQPYETYDEGGLDVDASIYADVNVSLVGNDIPDESIFFDRLAPFGTWYDDPLYGYVFTPGNANYTPYTNGYWKLTDFGWTWISHDQFGWATDHYGRWVWRNRWVWKPDTTWGPAWVQWRYDDNVVGWAPLGYDVNAYIPETHWRFIPTTYITSRDLSRYYVRNDISRYVRDTRPVVRWNRHGNYRWVAGPDRAYLDRHRVSAQRQRVDLREIGRLDQQERRQADQRAVEARVKYRDRLRRETQVRGELERKRTVVETRQVEQQRQRVRAQPNPRATEQQRQQQHRQQDQQRRQIQDQQRDQRQQQNDPRLRDQRQQDQRQQDERQRVEQQKRQVEAQRQQQNEQRQRQQVEHQKRDDDARQQQQRQVEQRKQQNEARQQQQRQQVEERKQQNEARQQQQRQQVEERKQQHEARQHPKAERDDKRDKRDDKRDNKRDDKRDKRDDKR